MLSLSVFSLPLRFLSSAPLSVLATQPLFLPFLFLPVSASQWLPRCALSVFTSLAFPVLPDLISHVFFPGSLYSAYLSVSFRPSLIRFPQLFLRCLPYAFAFGLFPFIRLSFVYLFSGSGYSASVSSFPLSSRLRLTVASSVHPLRFHFLGFPRSFRPDFSCLLSRFFVLGLSVSFLSSLPASLPQLLYRCFPFAFAFGLSPHFAFFRPLSLGSDYSAFRLSFPFFPFSPVGGSFGAVRSPCGSLALPLPSSLLPCLSSDSVLSLLRFLSPFAVSPHSGYFSVLTSLAGSVFSPLLTL